MSSGVICDRRARRRSAKRAWPEAIDAKMFKRRSKIEEVDVTPKIAPRPAPAR